MTDSAPATPDPSAQTSVTLQTPIVRGAQRIARITLRRPKAGALRGIKLVDLMQMDAGAVMDLLPRVTDPTLLAHEVAAMDPADLISIATEIVGFLLPRAALETAAAAAADQPEAAAPTPEVVQALPTPSPRG